MSIDPTRLRITVAEKKLLKDWQWLREGRMSRAVRPADFVADVRLPYCVKSELFACYCSGIRVYNEYELIGQAGRSTGYKFSFRNRMYRCQHPASYLSAMTLPLATAMLARYGWRYRR